MVRNVKIPKRIGAIKVSKKVRKKVKKAVKAAASPFVRDFATAAMAAAGRAQRGGEGNGGTANEGRAQIMCGETRVHIEGSKVAEAFRAAAIDGFRRFLEGFEEGLRKAQDEKTVEPEAAKPAAKPKAAKAAKTAKPAKAAKPARKPSATAAAKRRPRSPAPGA